MNIKPIFDNVLIEPILSEQTESGFWLPESSYEDKDPIRKGRVLAAGKGKRALKNGQFIPTTVKKGQIVLYRNYTFIRYMRDRKKERQIAICSENDILAVIKK